MTDKEMKHLNRRELLEILINLTKDNNRLKEENEELRKRIEDRELRIGKAGSIAEAALALNGVFEAAEAAVEQYLENIRRTDEECERRKQEAEAQAAAILSDARAKATEAETQAGENAEKKDAPEQQNADGEQTDRSGGEADKAKE